MSETKIEWTDRTWNPTRGCSIVSPGCHHCYAMRQAARFDYPGGTYEGLTKPGPNGPQWSGELMLVESKLEDPLHWREPSMVFVNSMSDLFHEKVSDEWIDQVFNVMRQCPQHTFQVLTKRAKRMQNHMRLMTDHIGGLLAGGHVPTDLPNVWLGVSCEDQQRADERIRHLHNTPAAVRFLSCEPLLGHVNLDANYMGLRPWRDEPWLGRIGWVIVGGESGPNARPCQIEWIIAIVEQCKSAGVAVFVKQLGSVVTFDGARVKYKHTKGGDPSEWPADLRVREFPKAVASCER